jgi:hypothetical protein
MMDRFEGDQGASDRQKYCVLAESAQEKSTKNQKEAGWLSTNSKKHVTAAGDCQL